MYQNVSKIVGKSLVDGAQNIRGVWRIYLSDRPARLNLCVKRQINIKGVSVPVFDKNPSITKQLSPDEKREKITIRDIPPSVASQEIEQYLKDKNVGLVTDVKFAHERDPNGQLTSFKNGDRYIYAKGMIDPILTRNVFICGRKCRIFHEGQFVKECRACGRRNHGTGDVSCPAKNNEDKITAFSSYRIPLSNMYLVELKIEDETFKSVGYKKHGYGCKRRNMVTTHLLKIFAKVDMVGKPPDSWPITLTKKNLETGNIIILILCLSYWD